MTKASDLKIAYFSGSLLLHDERFIRKFSERHKKTYVVTIRNDLPQYLKHLPNIETFNLWNPFWPYDDPANKSYRLKTRIKMRFSLLYYAFELQRWLNQYKPDILHAGWALTDGYVASRSNFHPFLLMPWGSDILIFPDQSAQSRKRVIQAIKKSDAITCDAEVVYQKMVSLTPQTTSKRVVQFPWGIDLSLFQPNKSKHPVQSPLKCICVKNLKSISGFETLNEAIRILKDKNVKVSVEVYGEGENRRILEQQTKTLGLENDIHWNLPIPNEKTADQYRSSDVYVSTALSEGTSLSMMEAMACGLPVIATDLPAYRQWIVPGENGWLFPPKESLALANLLGKVSREDLNSIRLNNIQKAKKYFNWEENFSKLQKLYEDLKDYA